MAVTAGSAGADDVPSAESWPTPRCCRTHELEVRALAAEISSKAAAGAALPLSASETSELDLLRAASRGGDAWLVLVGGEHGGMMRPDFKGTRPGPYLAGHCSLQNIGRAYSMLVPFFGRSRVIVIAQLQETLQWLIAASSSEAQAEKLAGRSTLLAMLRQQCSEIQESCAQLLADGGADYDGPEVNAATVLHVLSGKSPAGKPAVPKEGVRSILLLMVSHGHAHPAGQGSKHHEWYMHLPYPVPEKDEGLYDVVSHEGFQDVDPHPDWDWGAPKRRWKLYSQMLFQAHHSALESAPQRRLVLFHQFCLSGGAAEFMRRPSYQAYCGTKCWPVFAVTTAGNFEPALGNFVSIWSHEMQKALREGGTRTLGQIQADAESRYWADNPGLKAENDRIRAATTAEPPDDEAPSTLGTLGCEAGFDGALLRPMRDVPVREVANIGKDHVGS
eukprot:TRINITY_DN50564_c0_g1_i1.p1 TRINITY_DN50564_c0_g1~~TRINITY_DN50564_c0_g1_i1.p1  ORF type:complete len:457 (+),score=64.51 TRINITY_DN50564_c0_g1_i1:35-1372(+)